MSSGPSRGGWSEPGDDGEGPGSLDEPGERYERQDLLGAGGMGRVYRAFDRRLQRTVALKEVAPHLAGTPAAQRLATEALLTADLEHPGIVSVHDAGRTDDGRLYYTMRLVRGRSLAERLADLEALPPAERLPGRLELLRHLHDACHAVGYAHARGVVHRDLKPANIMVGGFGETQVVDWGLARRIDEGAGTSPAGTDGYMSPEAAGGAAAHPRSDVFSLGVTLDDVMGPDAPPDLSAVAARARSPAPGGRYPDAHALAIDLGHFLDGRPVAAYRYSTTELLRRLVRAWRAPLVVGAVAALLLLALGASAWLRTTRARDRAIEAEAQATDALHRADSSLASSLEAQAASAARQGRLPTAQILAAHALGHVESPLARGVLLADPAGTRPEAVDVSPLPPCDLLALGLDGVACGGPDGLSWHPAGGLAAAWTVPGPVLAAAQAGDTVAVTRPGLRMDLLDRATGALRASFDTVPGERPLRASLDGRRVGIANGPWLMVVDTADGRRWDAIACAGEASAIAFGMGPDEAYVACTDGRISAASGPDTVRVVVELGLETPLPQVLRWADGTLLAGSVKGSVDGFDPVTGARRGHLQALPGPVDVLEPMDGDRILAVAGGRAGVRIWDRRSGVEILRLPAPTRAALARGPRQLDVAGDDLRRWTLSDHPRPRRFQVATGLSSIALSPDGRVLAGARGDGTVTVWSTESGAVLREDRWQERVAKWVAFRPDGSELLAAGLADVRLRRFDTDGWAASFAPPYSAFLRIAALSDGRVVGLNWGEGLVTLRDGAWTSVSLGWRGRDLAPSPDGSEAWILGPGGEIARVDDVGGGATVAFVRAGVRGLALGGGRLALLHEDHVAIVDRGGALIRELDAGAAGLVDVALSPDGRWAAAGLLDGTARLWSVEDGRLVATLVGHEERVACVAFSPDGRALFTGDWAGVVLRWSVDEALRPAAALRAEVEAAWRVELGDVLAPGR